MKKSLKLGTWYLLSFYKKVINAPVSEMNDIVVAVWNKDCVCKTYACLQLAGVQVGQSEVYLAAATAMISFSLALLNTKWGWSLPSG